MLFHFTLVSYRQLLSKTAAPTCLVIVIRSVFLLDQRWEESSPTIIRVKAYSMRAQATDSAGVLECTVKYVGGAI